MRFQTYTPQISADGSVVAYEGIAIREQLDTFPATMGLAGGLACPENLCGQRGKADWQNSPAIYSRTTLEPCPSVTGRLPMSDRAIAGIFALHNPQ
ncbi:hypothetical protein [Bradyrhizobium guangzhouense]|uniref:hypothetical protein n=1 Tax=Bradyrhizobium guangzhouense TaxID=1325095 RepID=UPI001009DC8A|nr:hypothetical protein [Bradyrhizobium guangzhouense]